MSERCGDVFEWGDGVRPVDVCGLPAGHEGWHSDGKGGYWEDEQ